jgi:hypothetical protein
MLNTSESGYTVPVSPAHIRIKERIVPNLELTAEEALLLKEILQSDLGDLRMEIADTDLQSFRDKLRKNEEVIKRIIDHLGKMN